MYRVLGEHPAVSEGEEEMTIAELNKKRMAKEFKRRRETRQIKAGSKESGEEKRLRIKQDTRERQKLIDSQLLTEEIFGMALGRKRK